MSDKSEEKKKEKKPCIQKRIKRWFRRPENSILLIMGGITILIYSLFMSFYAQFVFLGFLTELSAGILGVLWGFVITIYSKITIGRKNSMRMVNCLLVELNNNLESTKRFREEIKPVLYTPQYRYEIHDFFDLFQTNAWNMFSSRLELNNIEILFDLGIVYYRFELFNEATKGNSNGRQLGNLLTKNPDFLEKLEKDLESLIGRLNALQI